MKALLSQLCPLAFRSLASAALSALGTATWAASMLSMIKETLGIVGAIVAITAGWYSILAARSAIEVNRAKLAGKLKATDRVNVFSPDL